MGNVLYVLAEVNIYASVMTFVTLIIRNCFSKRINIAIMIGLWVIVLVRFCLPVTFDGPFHLSELLPETTIEVPVENAQPLQPLLNNNAEEEDTYIFESQRPASISFDDVQNDNSKESYNDEQPEQLYLEESISPTITLETVIFIIWLAGVICMLVLFSIKAARFSKCVKNAPLLNNEQLLSVISKLKLQLGIKQAVNVKVFDNLYSPALYGLIHPTILIPKEYVELCNNELEAIFAHELMHLKKHDVCFGYIWLAAKVLHWFNPLIWIAYNKYSDDVELYRDHQAALLINDDIQYSNALLHAAKISKSTSRVVLPTALLFKRKSKLNERVTRMIKPVKPSKKLGSLSIFIISLVGVLCFTTACQPSKDGYESQIDDMQDYIVSLTDEREKLLSDNIELTKENNNLEDQLTSLLDNTDADKESVVPSNWIKNVKIGTGIDINYDAKVVKPEIEQYSIREIVPARFSQKMVNNLSSALVAREEMLYYWNAGVTKEDLEHKLSEYLKGQEVDGQFVTPAADDPYIAELKERINSAPDSNERQPANTELKPTKNGGEELNLIVEWGKNDDGFLTVKNSDRGACNSTFVFQHGGNLLNEYDAELNNKELTDLSFLEKNAIKAGDRLIKALSIDDMKLSSVVRADMEKMDGDSFAGLHLTYESKGYVLIYTRSCDGMSVIDTSRAGIYEFMDRSSADYNPDYYAPWDQEMIMIYVDENSISRFSWNNYSQIGEKVAENVKLLPFDEIMKQADEQLSYQNGGVFAIAEKVDINVNRIELGWTVINDNDNPDKGLLVPAWHLFYDIVSKYEGSDDLYKERGFLILNAINGKVIDPFPREMTNNAEEELMANDVSDDWIAAKGIVNVDHYPNDMLPELPPNSEWTAAEGIVTVDPYSNDMLPVLPPSNE